jgi:hypothetical protein
VKRLTLSEYLTAAVERGPRAHRFIFVCKGYALVFPSLERIYRI